MYFNANKNVQLIKGKNNSLLVNSDNKSYVTISKKFYNILKECFKGKQIEKITNNFVYLEEMLLRLQTTGYGKIDDICRNYDNNSVYLDKNNLDMVWLPITENCNYKCIHCYENAKDNDGVSGNILGIKEYDEFFNKLTSRYKIKCVQITGGEPLLRGEEFVEKILNMLRKYKIPIIEIFSNLSLVNEDYIKLFKKYNVRIATSFYSTKPKVNDTITGVNGSYITSISKLDLLKENDIKFRVAVIILKQNEHEKDNIRTWLNNRYGLDDKKAYDIVRPIGRGGNYDNIPLNLFNEKYKNPAKHIMTFAYDYIDYNKTFNSCWGNKICLKSNGELYPCVMSKICIGKYKDVLKILDKKTSYRFLTKDKIKTCKYCEFRYLCLECRAMYSDNKKELKDKPFICSYNPKKAKYETKE